jgi:hypothetical protein
VSKKLTGLSKILTLVSKFLTALRRLEIPSRLTGIIGKSPIASLLAVPPADLVDFGTGIALIGVVGNFTK